jgi:hypothetical protein
VKSNNKSVSCLLLFRACPGVVRGHIHKVSIRREGYRVLRSGVTRMHCFASILEDRINIDGLDQSPVVIDQGPECQGPVPVHQKQSKIPFPGFILFPVSSHGSASRHQ